MGKVLHYRYNDVPFCSDMWPIKCKINHQSTKKDDGAMLQLPDGTIYDLQSSMAVFVAAVIFLVVFLPNFIKGLRGR